MVMRLLYRKIKIEKAGGASGFSWIESIKIPSIVALHCSQWLPGSVCDHLCLWWSNPSAALPAHAEYPRPVPPGRAGAGLGNHGALYWSLDSEMEWLIKSIFHFRMTEAKKSFHTRLKTCHVAEYIRRFTHPGQIHPVSCQLYRLSYLPFALAGGLCLVLSGRLTWADGAS